jgi:dimethylhistidine N-methyltransferase
MTSTTVSLTNHLEDREVGRSLCDDVRRGLGSTPKTLPPKWFYDEVGSLLFEQITRLPEYYPTEAERRALQLHSCEIAELAGADTLVELGSGASDKTTELLDAMRRAGRLDRYVPFDVSHSALLSASLEIASRYEPIRVDAVVGDFDRHVPMLPSDGRRLLAFLGGTIGNYEPVARREFLRTISSTLRPGESFLLGTDLVKDRGRLVRAYDDSAGITAAFNRNLLSVLNRELGAHFEPQLFDHIALWDERNEWIEMRLRSTIDQQVRIDALDRSYFFDAGEDIRTEISAKFRREGLEQEFAVAGLELVGWWTDPAGDFALSLSRRARLHP